MLVERPFEWWAKLAEAEGPCDVYAGAPVMLTPAEVARAREQLRQAQAEARAVIAARGGILVRGPAAGGVKRRRGRD